MKKIYTKKGFIMRSNYQICKRCVMDTSDPLITFTNDGICNHCSNFNENILPIWKPNTLNSNKLNQIINEIKSKSKHKKYDCILGLSGGVDSSYLADLASNLGLRILAVHVDAGWNSEIAVSNIEKICKKLNIELHTIVVDWESMKELQRSYLLSGLANQDVPQDHVFFSALYNFAVKNKINYVLHGFNYATESVLPKAWGHDNMDLKQIKYIFKRFSRFKKLKLKVPVTNFFTREIYYKFIKKMKVIKILNEIPYSRSEAIKLLQNKFDWKYYGGKHYESRFTKFFQGYYLPVKFGYDKRRAHLSSLILSNEINRDFALNSLNNKDYLDEDIINDKNYILQKLDLTADEFDSIMKVENRKNFTDYPSNYKFKSNYLKFIKFLKRIIKNKQ